MGGGIFKAPQLPQVTIFPHLARQGINLVVKMGGWPDAILRFRAKMFSSVPETFVRSRFCRRLLLELGCWSSMSGLLPTPRMLLAPSLEPSLLHICRAPGLPTQRCTLLCPKWLPSYFLQYKMRVHLARPTRIILILGDPIPPNPVQKRCRSCYER